MSFKYRFILSFVLLEIFFIILIVSINFYAINSSSKQLNNEKIESNITFIEELLKVPLSIFDIATLDNISMNAHNASHINSIIILDSNDNPLSYEYFYKHSPMEEIVKLKESSHIELNDEVYELQYKKIYLDDIYLGSLYIIFDNSDNYNFIRQNKKNTILLVILEIIISTIIAFILGSKLTTILTRLSEVAVEIGRDQEPFIPFSDKKDEIGILAKSMITMQKNLKIRNDKVNEYALILNNQNTKLVEANKSKDDFLANMSHELKTPLNSINVISSVMMKNKKGKLDEEQVKSLSVINHCGKDLLYLINDVLDISKLEAGEIILNYDSFDFYECMSHIKDMFEPQVNKKGLELVFDCNENIGLISSDVQRIKQIIKNLLSNALKFTAEGKIRLVVQEKDEFLKIIVRDDGIGIESEKLDYIFDRFKQVDGSTTRVYGGTGLGLAICKELAELLKGSIEVESFVNKGTTFTVYIPKNNQDIKIIPKQKESFEVKENEEKIEYIEENLKEVKKEKKNILLLNNDPVSFFSIVVDLKKISNLTQVKDLSALEKSTLDDYDYIAIDITDINEDKLLELLNGNKSKLILISKEAHEINDSLKELCFSITSKPLVKTEFTKLFI